MEGDASEIVLFFGRFHPLVLHVPIGFLTLAFLLEICSRFRRFHHFRPAVGFVLFLGAASAVAAAVLGYMLAQSGGYDHNLLSIHQWSGIAVAVIALLCVALRLQLTRSFSVKLDKVYVVTMSLMIVTLATAGHFGGSLTHGADYLTRYMPDGLRKLAGLPAKERKEVKKITDLNEAVVYADIIHPILDTYCISCHNQSKRKGDLMMISPEDLMKGGEDGPILVPGNTATSHMMQRIQLPESDEDHMPPEGKRQLSDEQVKLLGWWIDQGASFDKKVAEVKVPDDVQSILNELVDPAANKSQAEMLLASEVEPANMQTLVHLRAKGIMVAPLSDSIHWLQANAEGRAAGDSVVASLSPVSSQLIWLNLGGTLTSDNGLASLAAFKYLTRLDLAKTHITDDGLKHLTGLSYLESLNLYGTQVSDDGIQQLASLRNLKRLYVWKSRVTAEGASALEKSVPGLKVITGVTGDR